MSDKTEQQAPVQAAPVRAKVIKTEETPVKAETPTPVETKVEAPKAEAPVEAPKADVKVAEPKVETKAEATPAPVKKPAAKKAAAKPATKKAAPKKAAAKPAAKKAAAKPAKKPVSKPAVKKAAPKQAEAVSVDSLQDIQAQIAEQFQAALSESSATLNAVIKSSDVIAAGMQQMSDIWMELASGLVEDQIKAAEALSSCETLADLLKLQSDLTEKEYNLIVEEAEKLSKISSKVAEDAILPLNKRFDAVVKTMSQNGYF